MAVTVIPSADTELIEEPFSPVPLQPTLQSKVTDAGVKALNEPLKRDRIGERVDPLDSEKVGAYARQGFTDDVQAKSFVKTIYTNRFGLDPNLDFAAATRAVHGSSVDPKTAIGSVATWYAPITPPKDSYDDFKKLKPEEQLTEAFGNAALPSAALRAGNAAVSGKGEAPGLEALTPEEQKQLLQEHEEQLRGDSPKYRILDAERQLTPNQVTAVRLAAVHSPEAVQDLLAGFRPEDAANARTLLNAYAGVYDKGFIGNTWRAVKGMMGHRQEAFQRVFANLLESPIEGAGVYNTFRSAFPDNKLPDGSAVLNVKGEFTSDAAKQAVREAFSSNMPGEDTVKVEEFLANFPAAYAGGKAAFEEQKRQYLTVKAGRPTQKMTGDLVHDYLPNILGMLPDLAAGITLGAGTGGAGTLGYFSTDVFGHLRDELVFEQGLTPQQADNITAVAAVPYSIAMEIRGSALLPIPIKREFAAFIAKSYPEALSRVAKEVAPRIVKEMGQNWAAGMAGNEVMNITTAAAKQIARDFFGAQYGADLWQTEVIDQLIPNAIITTGMIGLQSSVRALQAPIAAAKFTDRVPVEKGGPAKLAALEAARDAAVGGEPLPSEEMVTLYRGQGAGKVALPEWAIAEAGTWFTTTRSKAEYFAGLREGGSVVEVQVPKRLLDQYRAAEGNPVDEYNLPTRFVQQANVTPERQAIVAEETSKLQRTLEEQRVLERDAPRPTQIASERQTAKSGAVETLVNALAKKAPGVEIKWVDTEAQLPEAARPAGAEDVAVEGSANYRVLGNKIYLVRGNLTDSVRALEVAAHEATHVGVGKLGAEFEPVLAAITQQMGRDKLLAGTGAPDFYAKASDAELASEHLSNIAEKLINSKTLTVEERGIWQQVQDWAADKLGFTSSDEIAQRVLAEFVRGTLKNTLFGTDEARVAAGIKTVEGVFGRSEAAQEGELVAASVEKPPLKPGIARFDGLWPAVGDKPAREAYSFIDPKTGVETSGLKEDALAAGMKLEGGPSASVKPRDKIKSDATVELAYRMLHGEEITPERAKEIVKQYFKGAGRVDDILLNATRLKNQLFDKALEPAQLVKELYSEEISQRYKDRLSEETARIQRKAYLEGGYDAAIEARKDAENLRREIVGLNELADEDRIPKMEKILRDTWRSGKAAGVDVGKPAETVMLQAIEAKETRLKLGTRAERQRSYENDLGIVTRALAGGEDTARELLTHLFGGEEAKRISRAAKGDVKETFTKLQDVLESRLSAMYKEKIIGAFSRLKGGKVGLTETAKEQLAALEKISKFPLDQLQKLNELRDKLKNLYEPMVKDGRMSPEQLEEKQAAYDGYLKGIAKFFEDMSFEDLDALHEGTDAQPGVARIIRESFNEKYLLRKGVVIERAQRGAAMLAEVQRGSEAKLGVADTAKGGTPGALGWLKDANTDLSLRALRLAGGKQGSTLDQVLSSDPFDAESAANLARVRLTKVADAKMTELGISYLDLNRWKHDTRIVNLGTGRVGLTTLQIMNLYNAMKDPLTQVQYGNTRGLKPENLRGRLGGVKFGDADNATRQIKALTDTLTDAQRALADTWQKAMQDGEHIAALNGVSLRREGEAVYNNGFYWPLARDIKTSPIRSLSSSLNDLQQFGKQGVENLGFTKRRVANKNDILIEDAHEVFQRHLYDSTRYAYMTEPMLAARDALQEPALHTAIVERIGEKGVANTLETYRRMVGIYQYDPTFFTRAARFLQQNIARGLLWLKVPSWVKARVTGGESMMGVLAGEHGTATVARFVANTGLPFKAFWLTAENKAAREYLLDHGYFAERFIQKPFSVFSQTFNAGLEGATSSHALDKWNKVAEAWGAGKIFARKASEFGMTPFATADLKTAVATYRALTESGLSPEAARARTVDYIRRTQPPSSAADETSAYRAFSHPGLWLIYPFMGASSRAANLLQRSLLELRGAQTTTTKAAAMKKVIANSLATLAVVTTGTLFSAAIYRISTGKSFTYNEDDEKRRDAGYAIGESLDALGAPGGGLLFKTAFSLATEGKIDSMSTVQKQLDDLGKGLSVVLKAYERDVYDFDDERIREATLKLGVAVGTLVGIPLGGPAADAKLLHGLLNAE